MQELGDVGPKTWGDSPVYVVGGGPTLRPFSNKLWLLYQRGKVIAVNDSYRNCYFPDAIFSLDHKWLSSNLGFDDKGIRSGINRIPDMPGLVFCAVDEGNPRIECENLTYIHRKYRGGLDDKQLLSENPAVINNGMTSGFGALGFAYLKGAKTIYLLGFDFKDASDGATHFHRGYEWHNRVSSNRLYKPWAEAFNHTTVQLKSAGVEVFNCSPDSQMTAFPYKPYSEVL